MTTEPSTEPHAKNSRGVARAASVISRAGVSSRLLGLVREQVFAAFFGAGAVFDAFVAAFRVPNLFRDLFAEGALSSAFVKTFTHKLEKEGEQSAWRLASQVANALAIVVGGICVVGTLCAPFLLDAIAPGFSAEKRDLAVTLTRVMFPFLLLVALASVAMGALNARGVFGLPAMASTFFNVGSIVAGLLASCLLAPDFMSHAWGAIRSGAPLVRDGEEAARAILGMAIGVLVGGLLQLLVQVPPLRARGWSWRPGVDWRDPGLVEVFRLMGPAVIGTAAVQINVFVNTWFASWLVDGAVSWLNYSFRLMQFPIGVFGVAIATATLPAIARATARKDEAEYRDTLSSSLSLALFLTVPSAVGLIVLGRPIIALIYERGSFDTADTAETAAALSCYAIGLVAYSLIKILAPAFYAVDDSRTPMRVSLAMIFVNLGLNAALARPLGHRGLALSTSLVACANAALLLLFLRRRVGRLNGRVLARGLVKILVASGALGAASWFSLAQLEYWWPGERVLDRSLVLGLAMSAGLAAFVAACFLLRVDEMRDLARRFARRR